MDALTGEGGKLPVAERLELLELLAFGSEEGCRPIRTAYASSQCPMDKSEGSA